MDTTIHDVAVFAITLLLVSYGLWMLVRVLGRGREGFHIGRAVAVAVLIRIVASMAVSLTSIERLLRGGDEIAFLKVSSNIADTTFGSTRWIDSLTGSLYEFVFAGQIGLFDSPVQAMRVAQIGIAVAGLIFLAAAVYELAGPRAAVIAMWFLAVEPTNVFFSSILHKEPLMMLAGGMVAYGGTLAWQRGSARSILLITLGCLIAVATRPYAGWFLIAAGAAIILHSGLRTSTASPARRLSFVALVVVVVAVAAPTVLGATTDESLQPLQQSQDSYTSGGDQTDLALERVDFSTRTAIVTNLPGRIVDVLTRPYLWQMSNAAQQLAVFGSAVALALLVLLVRELRRDRKGLVARAGPLLYVSLGLLIAYSLSAGNAGTAFRYRTHIVVVAGAALIAARYGSRPAEAEPVVDDVPAAAPPPPPPSLPVPATPRRADRPAAAATALLEPETETRQPAIARIDPAELAVFIVSNEPWGPQHFIKHRFATELARQGAEVFFCDPTTSWQAANIWPSRPSLSRLAPNLQLLRYRHPVPAQVGSRLAGGLNDRIVGRRLRSVVPAGRRPILWQFDPFRFAANLLGPDSLKIYHVCDPYVGLDLDGRSAEAADLIVCTSRQYAAHYAGDHPSKTIYVPHASAVDHVEPDDAAAATMTRRFGDYLFLGGSITDRVDVPLLARVSEAFPDTNLVVAGPEVGSPSTRASFAALKARANVVYRGTVTAAEISAYVAGARACLSAYYFNERSRLGPRTSVLKVMDYLAGGRPVVSSSPLEYAELEGRAIYCRSNAEEYVDAVGRVLAGELTVDVEAVDEFLAARTYRRAVDRVLEALAATVAGSPVKP